MSMHGRERPVSGEAVPGVNHRNNEAERCGIEGEDLSRQRIGFIDDVFDLVHRVLQKHEIPEAFDRCSDSEADSSALFLDAKKDSKKTGAEVRLL